VFFGDSARIALANAFADFLSSLGTQVLAIWSGCALPTDKATFLCPQIAFRPRDGYGLRGPPMGGRPRRGRTGAVAAQFVRCFGGGPAFGCSARCRSACLAMIAARLSSALLTDPFGDRRLSRR
jgi:hypothetical protein